MTAPFAFSRFDARTAWKSEPYDLTPWLRARIELLGEALGLEIDADVQEEVAVGIFSADLLGTDLASTAAILVENQLEQTVHSHLGQLLTSPRRRADPGPSDARQRHA